MLSRKVDAIVRHRGLTVVTMVSRALEFLKLCFFETQTACSFELILNGIVLVLNQIVPVQ